MCASHLRKQTLARWRGGRGGGAVRGKHELLAKRQTNAKLTKATCRAISRRTSKFGRLRTRRRVLRIQGRRRDVRSPRLLGIHRRPHLQRPRAPDTREASNEDSNWLDVSDLSDEEIGLFPCDREELDGMALLLSAFPGAELATA